jgi:PAS domain S-box-containing protein
MQSLDNVIATVDRTGRFTYMNANAASQLGGKPQDFIGKSMRDLFPKPAAESQMANIEKVFVSDKGATFENLSFVQGQPRWFRTAVEPIHDAWARNHVLINSMDIHDLKSTQSKLEELNRSLEERVEERTHEVQDLYDHAPTGYFSLDSDATFILINETALKWLGYTREELIGKKKLTDLLIHDSKIEFYANYQRFIQRGTSENTEIDFIRQDGSISRDSQRDRKF